MHEFEVSLEESLIIQDLQDDQQIGASGFSKNEIDRRLCVYTTNYEIEEEDPCPICLLKFVINVKMARLECGHPYHV